MSEKVLEINGLNCGYGSVQILYDIDLYVDKGEFVTIIGPNGCGKSTLIKTIFGIATHYSGTVQHEGEEVSGWRTGIMWRARSIRSARTVQGNLFPPICRFS